jgi:thioredoxin 1
MAEYRKALALTGLLSSLALLTGCGIAPKPVGGLPSLAVAPGAAQLATLPGESSSSVEESTPKPADQQIANPGKPRVSFTSTDLRAPGAESVAGRRPHGETPTATRTPRSTGKVEHVGESDFESTVLGSSEPVLVDFYADWCGPCRKLAPVLDRVARDTPSAKVVKVNIDHNPGLARTYGVRSIPTLLVFKDGQPVARRQGWNDQDSLQSLLARY